MIELNPNECRVLGTLVEKAQTTPAQYPLTLNALRNGCNQKNNRFPVVNLTEDHVFDALESLRAKGLVREIMLSDSRVPKYRHHAREVLVIETAELVVLTEMLLRGPQTVGELRGRASRMHPLDTLEAVEAILKAMCERPEPLARRLPPVPGSRAPRYQQLLCASLHPEELMAGMAASMAGMGAGMGTGGTGAATADSDLEERVRRLEEEVASLRQLLEQATAPS